MKKKISIIDDNTTLLTSLSIQFKSLGYSTITFSCPEKALKYHEKATADVFIIDIKMPKIDGLEFYELLCKKMNKDKIPALFLTGVKDLEKKALTKTTIADFVHKPFNIEILEARIKKVLSYFKSKENNKVYKIGNLEMFEEKIMCAWFKMPIELTKTEFNILNQLAKRPFVVYSRDQLLDSCNKDNYDVIDRNIDSHIKRIRKKFRKANPKIEFDRIKTHYGIGYAWAPQSLAQQS